MRKRALPLWIGSNIPGLIDYCPWEGLTLSLFSQINYSVISSMDTGYLGAYLEEKISKV